MICIQPSPACSVTLFGALRYHLHCKDRKVKLCHGQTESLGQKEEPNKVSHPMLMPGSSFSIKKLKNQPVTAEQVKPDGFWKAASQLPCLCTTDRAEPGQTQPQCSARPLPAMWKNAHTRCFALLCQKSSGVALSLGILGAPQGLCVGTAQMGSCTSGI